jgi:hypothetical protein
MNRLFGNHPAAKKVKKGTHKMKDENKMEQRKHDIYPSTCHFSFTFVETYWQRFEHLLAIFSQSRPPQH